MSDPSAARTAGTIETKLIPLKRGLVSERATASAMRWAGPPENGEVVS